MKPRTQIMSLMKSLCGFAAVCLMASPAYGAATSVFVEETVGVNVSTDEAKTITELVKSSVVTKGQYQVVSDRTHAQVFLKPKLMGIGESYILTLDKIVDGKSIFSSQLKVGNFEDVDTVANRLTRSVIDETVAAKDINVDEVSDYEANRARKRKETVNRWYLGFGPSVATGIAASDSNFDFAFGYSWEIASSNALLTLYWEGIKNMSQVSLGGRYYFNDHDTSPYVAAAMGYGSVSTAEDLAQGIPSRSEGGFVGTVGGGLQLFRTSKVGLDLGLTYNFLARKVDNSVPSYAGFKLGLFF